MIISSSFAFLPSLPIRSIWPAIPTASLEQLQNSKMPTSGSRNQGGSSSSFSHGAFSKVDELVSKPVLGSDGAASWQQFQKESKGHGVMTKNRPSTAPRAPLKKADKLGTGLTSWDDERRLENTIRQSSGHATINSGYTVFKKKGQGGDGGEDDDDNNNDDGNDDDKGTTKNHHHRPAKTIKKKERELIMSRKRPDDVEYFIKSPTFKGWKFDYVFTTRDTYGTGYYWDGMDSIKKLNGEELSSSTRQSPTVSSTKRRTNDGHDDDHDNDSNAARGTQNSDDEHKQDKKKSKKDNSLSSKKSKTKKKGPDIISDPNNPLEQVHAMLQQRQLQLYQQYHHHHQVPSLVHPDLPDGWEAAIDPSTSKTYYFHRQSGERRWEHPTTTVATSTISQQASTEENNKSDLPDGWEVATDASTGKTYYFHRGQGKTSWEKPQK
jgi:hypothetical protein